MSDLVPVKCKLCHLPMVVELPDECEPYRGALERTARMVAVHDACYDIWQGKSKAAKILADETAKLTSWKTLCPPEFQKPIDWSRKAANRSNLNKILAWTCGEKGLLVLGESGKCKTRFVWKLLEREWTAGRTMAVHTHTKFRATVSALASGDQQQAVNFASALAKTEILFIDDLGKGRATPASEEAFFDLLDKRMTDCRPTLFTSDLTLNQIEQHFSDEYSRGLMRRILERTEQVQF
jgi:DNA replication protein DnaC